MIGSHRLLLGGRGDMFGRTTSLCTGYGAAGVFTMDGDCNYYHRSSNFDGQA